MNKLLSIALLCGALSFATNTFAQTKICVISDTHYFDPSLLISNGSAFQTYLAYDRKMLQESEAILQSVLTSIKNENPDVLLISGDLTKDGEKSGHEKLAAYLKQLEDETSIEIIVTPGNHDINNPHAVSFDGATTTHVESVTPEEFKTIYADFGFNQAIASHSGSLSFVYPISNELVLISMDVCRYNNNLALGKPETAGGFSTDLLTWAKEQAAIAKTAGKTVLGMMHHGLLEHYSGQKTIMGEYVIDDWDNVSTQLAEAGFQAVFTGHYHAQDIVAKSIGNKIIYDIETGSTVTYPCPYRIVEYTADKKLAITGNRVQTINYELGGKEFQTYSKDFITAGLPPLVKGMLMSAPYSLPADNAAFIEPAITETFIAHYEGNEGTPSPQTQGIISYLKNDANFAFMGNILQSIWDDSAPDDWTYTIDLAAVPTSITKNAKNDIKVMVNANKQLIVDCENLPENSTVSVFYITGNLVSNQKLINGQSIVSPSLQTGIYLIELHQGNLTMTQKIIVK